PCSDLSSRPSFWTLESAFLKKALVSRARVSFSTLLSFSERNLVGLSGALLLVGPSETTCPGGTFSCFSWTTTAGGRLGTTGVCGPAALVLGPPRIPWSCERLDVTSETTCWGGLDGAWKIASRAMPSSKRKCATIEIVTAVVRRLPRRAGCCGRGIARLL